MTKEQLEAIRDHLGHLATHHGNLAKKRELERLRMEPAHHDLTEERKHELLDNLFSGLVGAVNAALTVTK